MTSRRPSQIALAVVIVVVGANFVWWLRERPSYLLYKAHRGVGEMDQSAAIAEYKRMLKNAKLTKQEQSDYRLELAALYLRALEESRGLSRYVLEDPNQPGHPFLDEAKKEIDRVLKDDPDNAKAHMYLGEILWLRNLETYAIQELETGRQKDPTNPDAFRYLSAVYLDRGDNVKARDLALKSLAITPDYDEARMLLVEAYDKLGDDMSALREYDRLTAGYQDIPAVRAKHALYLAQQNYWDDSDRDIQAALRASPSSGEIKIIYGQLLLDHGSFDAAVAAFTQAGELMPRNVWPMIWRCRAEGLRGNCEETARVGEMVTSAWGTWPWGRLTQAWAYQCRGDEKKALSQLDEAVRLSPDFAEALKLRARLLLDRGQFDQLGVAIRPMLDEKILETDGYVFLALSLVEQGNKQLASEMAETAIRLNPRHAEAFAALGETRAELRDSVGAERAFATAVDLNPYNPELKARELRFLARTGQKDVANNGLKDLAARFPFAAGVWLCWGDVQLIRGEYSDAILSYQNALGRTPGLMRAHLGLVECYARMGNSSMTALAFQRASEINPRHPFLLELRRRFSS